MKIYKKKGFPAIHKDDLSSWKPEVLFCTVVLMGISLSTDEEKYSL